MNTVSETLGGQGESVSWRILGITVFTLFKIMMHALSFLSGVLGWGFCVRVCVCVLSWSQAPGIFLTLPQAHQHIYLGSGNPSSGAHSLPRELAPESLRSLSYRRSWEGKARDGPRSSEDKHTQQSLSVEHQLEDWEDFKFLM